MQRNRRRPREPNETWREIEALAPVANDRALVSFLTATEHYDMEDGHLEFGEQVSLAMVLRLIRRTGITSVSFTVPRKSPRLLEELIDIVLLVTNMDYYGIWPRGLPDWLEKQEEEGNTYLQLKELRVSNLFTTFELEDFSNLFKVFPNLRTVRYLEGGGNLYLADVEEYLALAPKGVEVLSLNV